MVDYYDTIESMAGTGQMDYPMPKCQWCDQPTLNPEMHCDGDDC